MAEEQHVNIVVSVDDKASKPLKDINESIRGTQKEAKGFASEVFAPITQGASKFAEAVGIPSKAIDALGDSFHKAKAPVGDLALAIKGMASTAVADIGGLAKTTGIVVDTVGVLTASFRIATIAAVGLGAAAAAIGKALEGSAKGAEDLKYLQETSHLTAETIIQLGRVSENVGIPKEQIQASVQSLVELRKGILENVPAYTTALNELRNRGPGGREFANAIDRLARDQSLNQEQFDRGVMEALKGVEVADREKALQAAKIAQPAAAARVFPIFKEEEAKLPPPVLPDFTALEKYNTQAKALKATFDNLTQSVMNALAPKGAEWLKELNDFLEKNKGVIGETILTFLNDMAKLVHDIAVVAPPVVSLIKTITGLPKAAAKRLGIDTEAPMLPIKGGGVVLGAEVREGGVGERLARHFGLLEGQKEAVGEAINQERLALERGGGQGGLMGLGGPIRKGTDVEEKGPLAPLFEELKKYWWRPLPTREQEEAAGFRGASTKPAAGAKSSSLDFGIITPAAAGELSAPGAAAFGDVQHARRRYREIAQSPAGELSAPGAAAFGDVQHARRRYREIAQPPAETKPAAEAPATFAERFGALPTDPLNTLAEEALRAAAALNKISEAAPTELAAPAATTPATLAAPAEATTPATAADVQHARRRYREMMQPPLIELPEITTTPTAEAPATFAERFGTPPPTTEKPSTLTEEALRASALKRQASEGEPVPAEMTPDLMGVAEAAFAERFEGSRVMGVTGETETRGEKEGPKTLAEEAQRASEALSNLSEASAILAERFGAVSGKPDDTLAKISEALRASQIKVPSDASPKPFSLGDVNASKLPTDVPQIDDRSLAQMLEASMAAHAGTTRVEGSAKLTVDVNAPRGTMVNASTAGDLFQEVELNRSSQMAMADDSA